MGEWEALTQTPGKCVPAWNDVLYKQEDACGAWGSVLGRGKDGGAVTPASRLGTVPGNCTSGDVAKPPDLALEEPDETPQYSEFRKTTEVSPEPLRRCGWHHTTLPVTSWG